MDAMLTILPARCLGGDQPHTAHIGVKNGIEVRPRLIDGKTLARDARIVDDGVQRCPGPCNLIEGLSN